MKKKASEVTVLLSKVKAAALPIGFNIKKVQEVFWTLLKHEKIKKEITVVLTNDSVIKKLNKDFRYRNIATDVLSFEYSEEPGKPGEIVVSLSTAKRQAGKYGNTYRTELITLLVHGFYHILGHKHYRRKDYAAMKKKENTALKILKIKGYTDG